MVQNRLPKWLPVFLQDMCPPARMRSLVSHQSQSLILSFLLWPVHYRKSKCLERHHIAGKVEMLPGRQASLLGDITHPASCLCARWRPGGATSSVRDHCLAAVIPNRPCNNASPGDGGLMYPTPTKQTWLPSCLWASVNI